MLPDDFKLPLQTPFLEHNNNYNYLSQEGSVHMGDFN